MVAKSETRDIALADIRLLAKATELGSLSAAARSLGMPKATASRQLQRIERTLGCLLIHRGGRRFSLTEEGRALLPHALRGLAALDEGVETILAQGRPLDGMLRIAAPYTYGRKVVAPRLPKFMARHPMLHVSLVLGSQHADLLADEADIAIRVGDAGSEALIARKIGTETFVLCAAPAYLVEAGMLDRPHDLARHRFVDLTPGVRSRDLTLRRNADGRSLERKITVNPVLRSNEPEVVIQALLQGVGVGVAPNALIADFLVEGSLIAVLEAWTLPTRTVNALYAPGRGNSPKIRAFLDYLVDALSSDPARLTISRS